MSYKINPIGFTNSGEDFTEINVLERYGDALEGLPDYSHIIVLIWLHERDTDEERNMLKVHPRHNKKNPLTGIFATRSPVRPNPVAVFIAEIRSIQDRKITVDRLDVYDNSPVIDIKPYIPSIDSFSRAKTPDRN